MSESTPRTRPWAAMVRESLAVLAAILVAFALDAWWDERTERRDALDALDAVRVELERNRIEFERVVEVNEGVVNVLPRMLELDEGLIAAMSREELDSLDFSPFQIMQPETGALQSLLTSGHLRAIRDQEPRSALAGHSQSWDEVTEDGVIAGAKWTTAADIWIRAIGVETAAGVMSDDVSATRLATLRGHRSDDFMAAALSATVFTRIYLDELRVLRDELDALATLIAAETGG